MENSSKSAYPILGDTLSDDIGLTKREYFAALAMQGLLHTYATNGQYGNHTDYPMVHEIAVRCADDLLKELKK